MSSTSHPNANHGPLVPDLLTLHLAEAHATGKLASWHSGGVQIAAVVGRIAGDVEDENSVAVRGVGDNVGAGKAEGAEDEVKFESVAAVVVKVEVAVAVESLAIPAPTCEAEVASHNFP